MGSPLADTKNNQLLKHLPRRKLKPAKPTCVYAYHSRVPINPLPPQKMHSSQGNCSNSQPSAVEAIRQFLHSYCPSSPCHPDKSLLVPAVHAPLAAPTILEKTLSFFCSSSRGAPCSIKCPLSRTRRWSQSMTVSTRWAMMRSVRRPCAPSRHEDNAS